VLRHVALFRWKPETTAEDVSKVEGAPQDGNADFALVADPIMARRDAIQYVIDHND
jgi:hypothetical protein